MNCKKGVTSKRNKILRLLIDENRNFESMNYLKRDSETIKKEIENISKSLTHLLQSFFTGFLRNKRNERRLKSHQLLRVCHVIPTNLKVSLVSIILFIWPT